MFQGIYRQTSTFQLLHGIGNARHMPEALLIQLLLCGGKMHKKNVDISAVVAF